MGSDSISSDNSDELPKPVFVKLIEEYSASKIPDEALEDYSGHVRYDHTFQKRPLYSDELQLFSETTDPIVVLRKNYDCTDPYPGIIESSIIEKINGPLNNARVRVST